MLSDILHLYYIVVPIINSATSVNLYYIKEHVCRCYYDLLRGRVRRNGYRSYSNNEQRAWRINQLV